MKFTTLCLQLRNKSVGEVNNHTGNSQNYNYYSYVLNNPLKYTDLYGNRVSWETAVGASLAAFGGSLENVYSSSTAGFNLYLVSAFGNTTIVSSFGDIGNIEYGANGGLTFENQTAGAYLDELFVRSSCGGDDFSLAGMYLHFQFGGGKPMTINMSSIDFSGTSQKDLGLTGMTKGDVRSVNLFNAGTLHPAALAFGRINMTYYGNNQFSIVSDKSASFDFYPLYDPGASMGRNVGNIIGAGINYNLWLSPAATLVPFIWGGPYPVYFNGTTTIPK